MHFLCQFFSLRLAKQLVKWSICISHTWLHFNMQQYNNNYEEQIEHGSQVTGHRAVVGGHKGRGPYHFCSVLFFYR